MIKLSTYLISVIIILLPIVDSFTGVTLQQNTSNISISLYYRMILLLLLFLVTLLYYYKYLFNITFFALVLMISSVNVTISFSSIYFIPNILLITKTLYAIIAYYGTIALVGRSNKMAAFLGRGIRISAILYLSSIILASIFNYGVKNYGLGSRGFLYSGNDVALVLLLAYPLIILRYKYLGNLGRIAIIVGLVSTPLMATKSSIMVFIIALIILLEEMRKLGSYKILLNGLLLSAIAAIIVVIKSDFIAEVVYMYNSILIKDSIVGLLFRGRNDIMELSLKLYQDLSVFEKIFGISPTHYQEILSRRYSGYGLLSSEMDAIDILLSYGITGLLAIYGFSIHIYRIAKKNMKRDNKYLVFIVYGYFIHSIFAGHATTSPIVGLYYGVILGICRYLPLNMAQEIKHNTNSST